jgi:hypothetical protein
LSFSISSPNRSRWSQPIYLVFSSSEKEANLSADI